MYAYTYTCNIRTHACTYIHMYVTYLTYIRYITYATYIIYVIYAGLNRPET